MFHSNKKEIQKDRENKILGPTKKLNKLTSMKCVALMMKVVAD